MAILIAFGIVVLAALSYWAYRRMKGINEDFFAIDEWLEEEYEDEAARKDGEE